MPKWLLLATDTAATPVCLAFSIASFMAWKEMTWPMPLRPSISAELADSRTISQRVTGSMIPVRMRSMYILSRPMPCDSMPRRSERMSTSTMIATSASGTPTLRKQADMNCFRDSTEMVFSAMGFSLSNRSQEG